MTEELDGPAVSAFQRVITEVKQRVVLLDTNSYLALSAWISLQRVYKRRLRILGTV
jgi:hypothetical protein